MAATRSIASSLRRHYNRGYVTIRGSRFVKDFSKLAMQGARVKGAVAVAVASRHNHTFDRGGGSANPAELSFLSSSHLCLSCVFYNIELPTSNYEA